MKMKINLRKAKALQIEINEVLKRLSFESTVSVNEFQDPEAMITAAAERFTANILRRDKLLRVLYSIRKAVYAANNSVGVNDRLADVAMLERDIVFYSAYAKAAVRLSPVELTGKIEKIKNQATERSFYGDRDVTSSVFNESNIESVRKTLSIMKKSKQTLQDELLDLNISTKITLTEDDIKVLADESIL
jgi:hypothetical protein